MILKYASFLIGVIWSYSIIKTQSVFSKKTGLIFKVFISNVSWLTLFVACYFGYNNFSIQSTIIGIISLKTIPIAKLPWSCLRVFVIASSNSRVFKCSVIK